MAIIQNNGFSADRVSKPILISAGVYDQTTSNEFYRTFNEDFKGSIVAELEASNKVKVTPHEEYKIWFDANKARNRFKVKANVVVTAGAAVTVTVDTYTDTAGKLSAPEVGLFFEENSTGVVFEVISVVKTTNGAHTASMKPVDGTQDVTIPVANAEFISIGRPSVQEASFQQAGEYSAWTSRVNEISIIRTNKSYTDLVSMIKIEERAGQSYMNLDKTDLPKQHGFAKERQIVDGTPYTAVTSTGNKNNNAHGIVSLVKTYGTSYEGQTLNDAFFKDLARAIDGNGFVNSYKGLTGSEAYYSIDSFLKSQNGVEVNLNINNGSKEEIAVIFDYAKQFSIYGVDYDFKKYDMWNSARTAGADVTKSKKAKQILLIPQGGAMNGAGEFQDYLRLRVLNNDLMTDEGLFNKFDTDGALFGKNTTRDAQMSLTSYMGADLLGVEGFVFVQAQ